MNDKKIKITRNGPYVVTGNIPLKEMIIAKDTVGYYYKKGRNFKTKDTYYLCRCGKTKTPPFCDGTHACNGFDGTLTGKKSFEDRDAVIYEGENLILKDHEELCAFARFCHSKDGDVWTVTVNASNKIEEDNAIKMACDCPAGRLIMVDKKTNTEIEPDHDKDIVLLQDPFKDCSGPIWVRGRIPIEDENGNTFQIRNRVTLCRCGNSKNKPYCDASHINARYKDDSFEEENEQPWY